MIEQKYMNTIYYGNEELVYLTTRSLFYDEQKNIIIINKNRYIDELKLYKYLKEKKVGSLLSSLLPIILANDSVEKSFIATYHFFKWIRKGITVKNMLLSIYFVHLSKMILLKKKIFLILLITIYLINKILFY